MITDFHTHILPEMDDGSSCIEESLAMLRMEMDQGIQHVVATPHFYPQYDDPVHFLKKREMAENRLRNAMRKEQNMPELTMGAEVYFFPGISESEVLSQLTIGKNGYILLEMPQSPWKESMYRELENIHLRQGLVPIIAHVDRYISPFRSFGIPERLAQLPVLVQANAGFFQRAATAPLAFRMLKREQIHLLGSDCHNMKTRIPNLGRTVEIIRKRLPECALDQIRRHQDEVLYHV